MKVAVIGAGLMGHGIALEMARAGHTVIVTDPVAEARDSLRDRIRQSMTLMGFAEEVDAALSRVSLASAVREAVSDADIVFEAAPEKMALKQAIFAEAEAHAPDNCILASNTSVMPISEIMAALNA